MNHEDHEVRIAVLETQMGRMVSDIESEKATRARANMNISEQLKEIDANQRKQEKIIWMGLGGLAVLQFIAPLAFRK